MDLTMSSDILVIYLSENLYRMKLVAYSTRKLAFTVFPWSE